MHWTPEMDRKLLAGVKSGRSRGAMAKVLGVSRSAAIARHARLRGIVYPSDRILREEARRLAYQRDRERERRDKRLIADLRRNIHRGISRASACRIANAAGAAWRVIGPALGMTHEGARIYALTHD